MRVVKPNAGLGIAMGLYGYNGSTWNNLSLTASPSFDSITVGHDTGSVRALSGSYNTAPLTDGQVLIGSAGNQPVPATLTGTVNRVVVSNASGAITLSTPQDIATSSSPAFAGLRVGTASGAVYMNAGVLSASPLSNGQILIGSTGTTPVAATITGTSNQISVTAGVGSITLACPQDIHTGASPTFLSLTLSSNLQVSGTVKFSGPGIGLGTALIRQPNGSILELTSSRAHKDNIKKLTDVHDVSKTVKGLIGRKYNYKNQSPAETTFGFIAEEVEPLCKEAVVYKDGQPHSLNYNAFIPIITEFVKTIDKKQDEIVTKHKELESIVSKHLIVKVTPDVTIDAENGLINKNYVPLVMSAVAIVISIILACTR
jgi:hypothetical protein